MIASGTTPDQHAVISTLAEVADAAEEVDPPALLVIGDVVDLAAVLGDRVERVVVEA